MASEGLLVTAESSRRSEAVSDAEVLQVARVATETARRAAGQFTCEGRLGERSGEVDLTEWTARPVGRATGTCRDAVTGREAARLRITTVSEAPAGRALTEQCTLSQGKLDRFRMTAYYGPLG